MLQVLLKVNFSFWHIISRCIISPPWLKNKSGHLMTFFRQRVIALPCSMVLARLWSNGCLVCKSPSTDWRNRPSLHSVVGFPIWLLGTGKACALLTQMLLLWLKTFWPIHRRCGSQYRSAGLVTITIYGFHFCQSWYSQVDSNSRGYLRPSLACDFDMPLL